MFATPKEPVPVKIPVLRRVPTPQAPAPLKLYMPWRGGVNQAYSRLSSTHGHITDFKLDSVVYVGVCVVIFTCHGALTVVHWRLCRRQHQGRRYQVFQLKGKWISVTGV